MNKGSYWYVWYSTIRTRIWILMRNPCELYSKCWILFGDQSWCLIISIKYLIDRNKMLKCQQISIFKCKRIGHFNIDYVLFDMYIGMVHMNIYYTYYNIYCNKRWYEDHPTFNIIVCFEQLHTLGNGKYLILSSGELSILSLKKIIANQ